MQFKNLSLVFQTIIIVAILILLNIIAHLKYGYFDNTEEKRYTLTQPTKTLLHELNDVVFVTVLLDGEFPAGFKRLQQHIKEVLEQFRSENGAIEYQFVDPNEGSVEEINERRTEFTKDGIIPVNLMVRSGSENKEKLIYPYAIIRIGERRFNVNLLENNPTIGQEENLNNSSSLLEYKLANGIQKLLFKDKKNLLFTTGNGELHADLTKSIEKELRPFYNIGRINLDSHYVVKKEVDVLVIARPFQAFSEKEKFIIDQYVMQGGRVIWFLDGMAVTLDSLMMRGDMIPAPLELNLQDQLFKYGLRLNTNLVLDLECTRIPQVIGQQGGKSQVELFNWYYHPLIGSKSNHPIVKNLDRLAMEFPSSLDTVKTKYAVHKIPLLQSSEYSRVQLYPGKVGFDILRYKPDPAKFDKPYQSVAYLLEGTFASLFENKVDADMQSGLQAIGLEFKAVSESNKMIVVSDGDVIKNLVDTKSGNVSPVGFNKYENYNFNGNKDFMLNAVEYLTNDRNILSARSKDIKLRLLDKIRAENETSYWRMLNIGLPITLLLIFGFVFNFIRKRKYAQA